MSPADRGAARRTDALPEDFRDLDILFRPNEDNVLRLIDALTRFGAPAHLIRQETLMSPDLVVQLGGEPTRIDLLNALSGVSIDEVASGAMEIELDGVQIPVIGLAELRRNKSATGRPRDLADLDDLNHLTRNSGAPS